MYVRSVNYLQHIFIHLKTRRLLFSKKLHRETPQENEKLASR